MLLAKPHARIGRRPSNLFFDLLKLCNAFNGLPFNGGALRLKHIHELSADMGHTSHLSGSFMTIELIKASIAICMDKACIARQMNFRALAFAVRAEMIPRNLGRVAIPSWFIAAIDSQTGCLGFTITGGE